MGRQLRWSEREGLRQARQVVQADEMDKRLRNRLWNAVTAGFMRYEQGDSDFDEYIPTALEEERNGIWRKYWCDFEGNAVDDIPSHFADPEWFKNFILFDDWVKVYDVLAFWAQELRDADELLTNEANRVLEDEMSAWHFIGRELVRRTTELEIQAIESALSATEPHRQVRELLKKSLQLFSAREKADYPNAIKEAVSALETLGRLIVHDPNATLGKALQRIRDSKEFRKIGIHSAVLDSFSDLYKYASDEDTIRHGAKPTDSTVGFAEAQMMIGACASAISYLIAKADAAGIPLTMEPPAAPGNGGTQSK